MFELEEETPVISVSHTIPRPQPSPPSATQTQTLLTLPHSSSIHDLILKVTFQCHFPEIRFIPAQEAVSQHGQILGWGIHQKGIWCPLDNAETSNYIKNVA